MKPAYALTGVIAISACAAGKDPVWCGHITVNLGKGVRLPDQSQVKFRS